MSKRVWLLILSVVVGCSLLLVSSVNAQGGDVCEQPNVLNAATCRFPGRVIGVAGYGAVRQGWNAFIAQGSPTFDGETHNGYDPEVGKDQHIFGSVPWAAGVWQHVNGTAPGNGYRLTVGWFVSTNCVGARGRVGIDPTGGDNPNSPNIVWSDKFSVCASKAGHKSVQAIAQSGRVSIWVWAEIDRTCGCGDQIWVTAVALTGDASVPTATPPPPTDTPRPPTPTRVPPTRTFTPVPATNTPAPTATPLPTNTPAATATATATTTPLPTDTPSPTEPIVPVVAIRRVTPTPTAKPSSLLPAFDDAASTDWLAVGLLGFAGCTFALAILVGVGMVAFWFWRRQ